jgi:hypothetical protein
MRASAASIRIQPLTEDLVDAVREFNGRLSAGGVSYRLPECPTLPWLPKGHGREMFQECYVAVDNGSAVRGGYILKRQTFMIQGERHSVGCYRLPLSEGLTDRKYGAVGLRLLTDALKREPLLYVLGIGGMHERLSRMLTALSWRLHAVPFHFKVIRPFRVARQLSYLRTTLLGRMTMDLAAFSGGAWLLSQVMGRAERGVDRQVAATLQPSFGAWTDELWSECKSRYPIIGDRSSQALDALYPAGDPRFMRVKVTAAGNPIGWAVLLATDMRQHKYFGNLRVGTIVDCLAAPDATSGVIAGAVRCLQDRGADLIVSNQMSAAWVHGLEKNGFRSGPSNFLFGASKPLLRLLKSDDQLADSHLNRGDGDGPINL